MWHKRKDTHTHTHTQKSKSSGAKQNLETDPCKYGQLIFFFSCALWWFFDKGAKVQQQRKVSLFRKWCQDNWTFIRNKKEDFGTFYTLYCPHKKLTNLEFLGVYLSQTRHMPKSKISDTPEHHSFTASVLYLKWRREHMWRRGKAKWKSDCRMVNKIMCSLEG